MPALRWYVVLKNPDHQVLPAVCVDLPVDSPEVAMDRVDGNPPLVRNVPLLEALEYALDKDELLR